MRSYNRGRSAAAALSILYYFPLFVPFPFVDVADAYRVSIRHPVNQPDTSYTCFIHCTVRVEASPMLNENNRIVAFLFSVSRGYLSTAHQ